MEWNIFFTATAAIAAAVSAFISLIQQVQMKRNEKEQRRIANQLQWYNKITLETIVPMINETIDLAERGMKECKGKLSSEKEVRVREVYESTRKGVQSIEENLQLVELFDKKIYKECSDKLAKIEEYYDETFNKASKQKFWYNMYSRQIHKEKKDIIKKLLEGTAKAIDAE